MESEILKLLRKLLQPAARVPQPQAQPQSRDSRLPPGWEWPEQQPLDSVWAWPGQETPSSAPIAKPFVASREGFDDPAFLNPMPIAELQAKKEAWFRNYEATSGRIPDDAPDPTREERGFDPKGQRALLWPVGTEEQIRQHVNPDNGWTFRNIVGQREAKSRIARAMWEPLKTEERRFTTNLLLEGPTSTGKTTLTRAFVGAMGLPLCEISGAQVKSATDVMKAIKQCLLDYDRAKGLLDHAAYYGIQLQQYPGKKYFPPAMIVFIDEAHCLCRAVQDALLKAVEPNDRILATEDGYSLDCWRMGWVLATTHPGELLEALVNRFRRIKLQLYKKEEIAQIVKVAYPQWDISLCRLIAYYSPRVPREALDLAREVAENQRIGNRDWNEAAAEVAKDNGIDQWGMDRDRLAILTALGQGPMSLSRLAQAAQCDEATCRDRYLPPLTTPAEGPALVQVSHRHFITEAGLAELDKRGIDNVGRRALPRQVGGNETPAVDRVVVKCPGCGAGLRLPKGQSGTVQCPKCQRPFQAKT
jgi:Holliday junction resolvasome RuvABC ATP-dependent DNA helicase subunit